MSFPFYARFLDMHVFLSAFFVFKHPYFDSITFQNALTHRVYDPPHQTDSVSLFFFATPFFSLFFLQFSRFGIFLSFLFALSCLPEAQRLKAEDSNAFMSNP